MTLYDNYPRCNHDAVTNQLEIPVEVEPRQRVDAERNVTAAAACVRTRERAGGVMTHQELQQSAAAAAMRTQEEGSDGDPAELLGSGGSDAKKRPLSVSSTSSSSTSSLPRHQRKKLASMTTSPIAMNPPSALLHHTTVDCSGNSGDVVEDMDITSDDEDQLQSAGVRDHGSTKQQSAPSQSTFSSDIASDRSSDKVDEVDTCDGQSVVSSENNNADCTLSYIGKVVAEILETERTYVRDLAEIIQVNVFTCFEVKWVESESGTED